MSSNDRSVRVSGACTVDAEGRSTCVCREAAYIEGTQLVSRPSEARRREVAGYTLTKLLQLARGTDLQVKIRCAREANNGRS